MTSIFDRMPALSRRSLPAAGLALLTGVAAVQAARLFWVLAAPLGPVGAPAAIAAPAPAPAANLAILSRFDPFFRGASASQGPAPEAAAYRLFAVRAMGRGAGSAIVAGPDGKQVSVQAGEAIAPGLTLAAVAADHVILASNGRRSRLDFAAFTSGSAPYQPPPAPPPPQTPAGFTFQPGAPGAEFLAAAGLQPGDVVTTVNGQGLTGAASAADLGLSAGQETTIQFERSGQVRTATVRIP